MRRIVAIALCLIAAGLLIALPATGADDGPYKVRAIFDNGGFIVNGEEVRVAGATIGTVESVDVSNREEIVSLEGGPHAIPGKAVVVMTIEDDGFKDFRQDAHCTIRPQSLIGEKFVDCTPTSPRAPGTEPPPELEQVPEGEPGEGQYLLPVENNGKAVDLDLIQNINRVPYRDRFRLILNDLGAGLAARGDDLGAVIDRANPALRQTNRVLKILANQDRQLASLASDGDAVLEPLARNRTSITGFFRNAGVAGEAAAERSADIEAQLQRFPEAFRQLRLTMKDLRGFADQGTPLAADIRIAAPHLSKATQKLAPFARAGIPAFTSLGDATEEAGPMLIAADPVLRDLATFANGSIPVGTNLDALLTTFSKTKGFEHLMNFIYYTVGSTNGFDQFGHFLRSNLQVTNCIDVSEIFVQGCESFFQVTTAQENGKKKKKKKKKAAIGNSRALVPAQPEAPPAPLPPVEELIPELDPPEPTEEGAEEDEEGQASPEQPGATDGEDPPQGTDADRKVRKPSDAEPGAFTMQEASLLLDYLLGAGS